MKNLLLLLITLLSTISMSGQCDLGGIEITSIYTGSEDPSGIDTDGDGIVESTDEFVEICNTSSTTVDISGWTIADILSGPPEYTFPTGTILASGKCLVIVTEFTGTPPTCVIDLDDPEPWIFEGSEVINLSDGTDAISATWGNLDCSDAASNAICCEEWCSPDPLCVNLPNTTGDCADVNPDCDYLPEELFIVLPVVISEFNVEMDRDEILIHWSTKSEINNDYFQIEWSTDGQIFKAIGEEEEAGSERGGAYSFIHNAPSQGINYYRLNQVDNNGFSSLSNVKSISFRAEPKFEISSTIVQDFLSITGNKIDEVLIYSQSGELVSQSNASNKTEFDLSALNTGIYIIQIVSGTASVSKKIMKM